MKESLNIDDILKHLVTLQLADKTHKEHYEEQLEEEAYDDRGECENSIGYFTGSIETIEKVINLLNNPTK